MKVRLTPVTLKRAKEFVDSHHRHNQSPVGWKFGVGIERFYHNKIDIGCAGGPTWEEGWELCGVAIAGRCVARELDKIGTNIEITRVCVLEERNGNSILYGAILRACQSLGYTKAYTYTLQEESGSSLKAVGFQVDEILPARETWSCPSRPRLSIKRPEGPKVRWVKNL